MDSLEYIDDYFKGLLTADQKKEFEQRILSDPSFAEELAFYLNTQALLKDDLEDEKRARFKELYRRNNPVDMGGSVEGQDRHQGGDWPQRGDRLERREPLVRGIGPVRKLWPYLAAAAVLVAVVAVWLVFSTGSSPDRLADQYIHDQLQNLPVRMSSVQDSLQKAIALYNEDRLPEALSQFERLLQRDSARAQARIYSGIVCLRLEKYDKALDYFHQLEADTTLYNNPSLFYQSLTLMKRNHPGDSQKARQLLQLVVDRDLDMKEDAQRLLLKRW
jgi:tetratricopeptide (TPR) repeat protein